jgi:hypothetical protein
LHSRINSRLVEFREPPDAPHTEAAGKLHSQGLIHHSRGHIKVLDRQGLEARACECYGLVKREFDRLLPTLRQTNTVI